MPRLLLLALLCVTPSTWAAAQAERFDVASVRAGGIPAFPHDGDHGGTLPDDVLSGLDGRDARSRWRSWRRGSNRTPGAR